MDSKRKLNSKPNSLSFPVKLSLYYEGPSCFPHEGSSTHQHMVSKLQWWVHILAHKLEEYNDAHYTISNETPKRVQTELSNLWIRVHNCWLCSQLL